MKMYSCADGHEFDEHEVKEWLPDGYIDRGRTICPYCWPDGFMLNTRKRSDEKAGYFLAGNLSLNDTSK